MSSEQPRPPAPGRSSARFTGPGFQPVDDDVDDEQRARHEGHPPVRSTNSTSAAPTTSSATMRPSSESPVAAPLQAALAQKASAASSRRRPAARARAIEALRIYQRAGAVTATRQRHAKGPHVARSRRRSRPPRRPTRLHCLAPGASPPHLSLRSSSPARRAVLDHLAGGEEGLLVEGAGADSWSPKRQALRARSRPARRCPAARPCSPSP